MTLAVKPEIDVRFRILDLFRDIEFFVSDIISVICIFNALTASWVFGVDSAYLLNREIL